MSLQLKNTVSPSLAVIKRGLKTVVASALLLLVTWTQMSFALTAVAATYEER
jgi:hypothetical protein